MKVTCVSGIGRSVLCLTLAQASAAIGRSAMGRSATVSAPRALPRLQRNHGYWDIAGTDLSVIREGRSEWQLRAWTHEWDAWLAAHGLQDVTFSTRTEALRSYAAAVAVSAPPPSSFSPGMRTVRVRAGLHRSPDGRLTATKDDAFSSWAVHRDGHLISQHKLLRQAQEAMALFASESTG